MKSSLSISSNEHHIEIEVVDVHSSLSSIIESRTIPSGFSSCSYLSILSMSSPLLSIPAKACNSESLTIFDLSAFKLLQSIEIGDENMYNANSLLIDNMIQLKSIKIGSNSFTKHKNSYGKDDSRSFRISNCDKLESIEIGQYSFSDYSKLESIEIGQYSFSDYSGKFELSNTPSLKSLKIGVVGKESVNFYYGSLTIQGNILWNNAMIS